jgi:uncharacterized protein (TIGR02246 family)
MKSFSKARLLACLLVGAAGFLPGAFRQAVAQDSPAPASGTDASPAAEAVHDELRAMRDAMMQAWQKRDLDAMLVHVDPDVVVTWQNGEVSRGPQAIKQFYQEMFAANGGVIADMKSDIKVDTLAILHGADTAIAYGSIHDDMTFKKSIASSFIGAGETLALDSRWSATVLRKNGAWKVASYHVSANLFSNPVMALAVKATRRMSAIGGFVAGALVVLLAVWIRRAVRKPASA